MIELDRADTEASPWPRGLSIFSTKVQGRTHGSPLLPFWSLQSLCRVTLETATTVFELHQSFLLCPLQSEGERMGGISLDQGEREKERGRQMMD